MQVPDAPGSLEDDSGDVKVIGTPPQLSEACNGEATIANKRKRDSIQEDGGRSPKTRILEGPRYKSPPSLRAIATPELKIPSGGVQPTQDPITASKPADRESSLSPTTPTTGTVNVREFISFEVSESINHGERRPDSVISHSTDFGEQINAKIRGSNGKILEKTIAWEVQPQVPQEIMIEEKEFAKTLSVLVGNALKFTDEGTIKISVALSPRSRYIVVTVTDNGCGIPESFHPKLFTPFSQEDNSITRQNEGLGLGLLVAKANARKLGGDLSLVKSSTEGPDKGSQFELRLPVSPSERFSRHGTPSRSATPVRRERSTTPIDIDALPPPVTSIPKTEANASTIQVKIPVIEPRGLSIVPEETTSPPSPLGVIKHGHNRRRSGANEFKFNKDLSKKYPQRILVAEDSSVNRHLLVKMLAKLGYTSVHQAYDGKEAVRLMEIDGKNSDKRIEMILMDLWMPNMDGYEATEKILAMQKKSGKNDRKVKILAVSADITEAALNRARQVGMVGFMPKPYKLMDLERLIVEHCQPLVD
jgi:CheY-like chemotaxis protein